MNDTRTSASGIAGRLTEWESAGLLTHDQIESISAYEQDRPVPATRRFGRLVAVVTVLGALLVGAGVMLTVAANWSAIPDLTKLAVLVVAVLGLETGGWRLRETDRAPRVGGALVLLGYLLYGAGIHLVAQIYHRPLDDPWLLLLWFAPGLPLAHVLRSPPVLVGALGVGYAALGRQMAAWFEPTADAGTAVFAVFLATGAALLAVGAALERTRVRSAVLGPAYRFVGTMTGLGLLYLGGFRWFYEEGGTGGLPVNVALWVGLMVSVALGSLVVMILRVASTDDRAAVADGVAVVVAVAVACWWTSEVSGPVLLAAGLVNLILLGAVLWLVVLGLLERRELLVNAALAVFALALFTRYVEIGLGMMGTGFSFIGSGVVLLGVGYGLERVRRTLLARMEVVDAS